MKKSKNLLDRRYRKKSNKNDIFKKNKTNLKDQTATYQTSKRKSKLVPGLDLAPEKNML